MLGASTLAYKALTRKQRRTAKKRQKRRILAQKRDKELESAKASQPTDKPEQPVNPADKPADEQPANQIAEKTDQPVNQADKPADSPDQPAQIHALSSEPKGQVDEGTETTNSTEYQLWLERERIFQEKFKKQKEAEEQRRNRRKQPRGKQGRGSYPGAVDGNNSLEQDDKNCSFFLKTGSCRYGEACSKFHPYPTVSSTILIKNMFEAPGFSEPSDDVQDHDDDLEYPDEEIQERFDSFWQDILPELLKYGEIDQLRVCRNHSQHLRGNVYVGYQRQEDAERAYAELQGRFYAGKQMQVIYTPIRNWKQAICGLFAQNRCERGKHCNFLHVFKNPNGQYEGRPPNRGNREFTPWRRRDDRRSNWDNEDLRDEIRSSRPRRRDSYRGYSYDHDDGHEGRYHDHSDRYHDHDDRHRDHGDRYDEHDRNRHHRHHKHRDNYDDEGDRGYGDHHKERDNDYADHDDKHHSSNGRDRDYSDHDDRHHERRHSHSRHSHSKDRHDHKRKRKKSDNSDHSEGRSKRRRVETELSEHADNSKQMRDTEPSQNEQVIGDNTTTTSAYSSAAPASTTSTSPNSSSTVELDNLVKPTD